MRIFIILAPAGGRDAAGIISGHGRTKVTVYLWTTRSGGNTINNGKEDMDAVVADITGGHMADFVIEGTGIPALLNRAQDLCFNGPNARLVLMSGHHGVTPEFDFRKAVDRGLSILVPHPPYAKDPRDDFRRAVVLMNNHTFYNDDMVTHRFGLEDMNTAFEMLDKKPKDFVKGVFIP